MVDAYEAAKRAGKDAAGIQAAMVDTINEIGPEKVSKHASDPKRLNVFDIAPSSIRDKSGFESAVRGEKRVAKFLVPPADPGYHLEIPQPQA